MLLFSPPAYEKKRSKSINLYDRTPTLAADISKALQDLYEDIRDAVVPVASQSEAEKATEISQEDYLTAVDEVIEAVEDMLTGTLYDRYIL